MHHGSVGNASPELTVFAYLGRYQKINLMKTKLSLAVAALLSVAVAYGQTGISLRSGILFGKGSTLGQTYVSDGTSFTRTSLTGSYGGGIPVVAGFSFNIIDCLTAYIILDYLCGRPVLVDDYSDPFGTNREEVKSTLFSAGAGVRFDVFKDAFINPYGQIGVSAPFIASYQTMGTQTFGSISSQWTERTTLRPGFGCDAEGGVDFNLSDRFALTAGITGRSLNLSRSKSEITEYTVDGNDQLSNIPMYQRMVNYQDQITEDSNAPGGANFDADQPGDVLRTNAPFSNWGILAGGRFTF
jgi:hypothetical protein